jgi:hypothetical protein
MSFYIFVVSDSFVQARPQAWQMRLESEGILYDLDQKFEDWLRKHLKKNKIDSKLAHFLTLEEIDLIIEGKKIDLDNIIKRMKGYILNGKGIITDLDFNKFCQKNNYSNPEDNLVLTQELKGNFAHSGKAKGAVKILISRDDISKIKRPEES